MSEIKLWHQDCIKGMTERLKPNSVDCVITSIPFDNLFNYTALPEDLGNNLGNANIMTGQFGLNFRFFLAALFEVMKPGSVFCCHIQQLLAMGCKDGYMGMRDFRGSVISMAMNHGFDPHGEVAILKDPRAVARRLQLHSLMFVTAYNDTRKVVPAMNDYVLFLRKPGSSDPIHGLIESHRSVMLVEPSPIIEYHQDGKIKRVREDFRSVPYEILTWDEDTGITSKATVTGGENINPDGWFTKNDWIKYAHGCWTDIDEMDVLERYKDAKENAEEKHLCPLQLEVIRRCMKLYSSPGQLVMDPFMGVGSTAVVANEQDRDCVGFELKESYHRMSVQNVQNAQRPDSQITINAAIKKLKAVERAMT